MDESTVEYDVELDGIRGRVVIRADAAGQRRRGQGSRPLGAPTIRIGIRSSVRPTA